MTYKGPSSAPIGTSGWVALELSGAVEGVPCRFARARRDVHNGELEAEIRRHFPTPNRNGLRSMNMIATGRSSGAGLNASK